ncbi:uncharacterized protein LOC117140601 [Drosophila mauritiana]|uniref:Uncharacterized protein LOC117140601 n=1 Tax=Drosophila mauritiana TaxID=7226 RepID=A0A6P8JTR9_DROMA|nr:uncharacterized protein LOC117140601 [Drosophila mauritiana]
MHTNTKPQATSAAAGSENPRIGELANSNLFPFLGMQDATPAIRCSAICDWRSRFRFRFPECCQLPACLQCECESCTVYGTMLICHRVCLRAWVHIVCTGMLILIRILIAYHRRFLDVRAAPLAIVSVFPLRQSERCEIHLQPVTMRLELNH